MIDITIDYLLPLALTAIVAFMAAMAFGAGCKRKF